MTGAAGTGCQSLNQLASMALQLIAHQLSLLTLFTGREQYIIPPYQRPYSWGEDQCQQLYEDIVAAFNEKNDYFLGNIVLAVSERETGGKKPRVVDGQQRLTTIWLMYKAFSSLFPTMKVLQDVLCSYNWDGSRSEKKIKSDVMESDDDMTLQEIYQWDYATMDLSLASTLNRQKQPEFFRLKNALKANLLFFFHRFREFKEHDGEKQLTEFLRFTLERVSLLPIELSGETIAKAEVKALTIFETINNRGMNLQDADIFKAKLYNKATTTDGKKDFIRRWQQLKGSCDERGQTIDDLFRYYSHIERGLAGITRNEISLRDFFTSPDSVLNRKACTDIMNDLEQINRILERYQEESSRPTALAKWLQLINIYTNVFPKYAAVAYLFRNGFDDTERLIHVLKQIVRYCYSMGSTTYVKYGIYTVIRQVMNGQAIELAPREVDGQSFFYTGKLKWGYALLAAYLEQAVAWEQYCCDHVLSIRDVQHMDENWDMDPWLFEVEGLGNLLVAGCPKHSTSYASKRHYYKAHCSKELRQFFERYPDKVDRKAIEERENLLISRLIQFFQGYN